eukprot:2446842-Prymnesium_polylepis.2
MVKRATSAARGELSERLGPLGVRRARSGSSRSGPRVARVRTEPAAPARTISLLGSRRLCISANFATKLWNSAG